MEIICRPAGEMTSGSKHYLVTCVTKGCKQKVRRAVIVEAKSNLRPGQSFEVERAVVEPCGHTEGVQLIEDGEYTAKWLGEKSSGAIF